MQGKQEKLRPLRNDIEKRENACGTMD
jgi:hypothetical protein